MPASVERTHGVASRVYYVRYETCSREMQINVHVPAAAQVRGHGRWKAEMHDSFLVTVSHVLYTLNIMCDLHHRRSLFAKHFDQRVPAADAKAPALTQHCACAVDCGEDSEIVAQQSAIAHGYTS